MNFKKVSDDYLNEIFNIPAKKLTKLSIKVLALDNITTPILSLNCSQTTLLENEIYLVENLNSLSNFSDLKNRETMRQLRCIVYISNSNLSIDALCKELQNPKYGEYQIFFNNTISKIQIEKLATHDHFEVITSVVTLYQDYVSLGNEVFYQSNQNVYSNPLNYLKNLSEGDDDLSMSLMYKNSTHLENIAESIASVILSLDVDVDIFFQKNSTKLSKPLSLAVNKVLRDSQKNGVSTKADGKDTCLLIVERFLFDPITPLLQPWTYQSMINEYLGIDRFIVDMSQRDVDILVDEDENKANDTVIANQQQHLVLNPKEDTFFAKTMYSNYGDLNEIFQKYLEDYKFKMKTKKIINDLQDIKNFILQYPEFNKLSKNVTKHMAIISELDSDLKKLKIWTISELEQNIVSQIHDDSDYAEFIHDFIVILDDDDIDFHYKLKLVLLFGLKNYNFLPKLLQDIDLKLSLKNVNFVKTITKQYQLYSAKLSAHEKQQLKNQTDVTTDFLYGLAKHFNKTASVNTGVPHDRNRDNLYMQHHPALEKLIYSDNILKEFTSVDFESSALPIKNYKNYVVYIVGGMTYEECRVVREFNSDFTYNPNGIKIVLGGTSILTTQDYLTQLEKFNTPNTI
ncbi:hypothetical protein QEN19_000464 [Hanseniaspora menglaensis]